MNPITDYTSLGSRGYPEGNAIFSSLSFQIFLLLTKHIEHNKIHSQKYDQEPLTRNPKKVRNQQKMMHQTHTTPHYQTPKSSRRTDENLVDVRHEISPRFPGYQHGPLLHRPILQVVVKQRPSDGNPPLRVISSDHPFALDNIHGTLPTVTVPSQRATTTTFLGRTLKCVLSCRWLNMISNVMPSWFVCSTTIGVFPAPGICRVQQRLQEVADPQCTAVC